MKFKGPIPETDKFSEWSDRLEKRIRQCILTLIVLLVVSQAAMQSPTIRNWLSATDRAEGIVWDKGHG